MKPTIGRTVHFVEHGNHYAATITAVHSDTCVNLTVFGYRPATVNDATGEIVFGDYRPAVHVTSSVQDEKADSPRSWHWPEREEEKPAKPASRGKQQQNKAAEGSTAPEGDNAQAGEAAASE